MHYGQRSDKHYSMSKEEMRTKRRKKTKITVSDVIITLLVVTLVSVVGYQWLGNMFGTPEVVSTNPANNEAVNHNLKYISVTFNKKMKNKWSWCIETEETFPKTVGKPSFDSESKTCKLPVSLEPNKVYELWLNKDGYINFKSTIGISLRPYKLTFTTGG